MPAHAEACHEIRQLRVGCDRLELARHVLLDSARGPILIDRIAQHREAVVVVRAQAPRKARLAVVVGLLLRADLMSILRVRCRVLPR